MEERGNTRMNKILEAKIGDYVKPNRHSSKYVTRISHLALSYQQRDLVCSTLHLKTFYTLLFLPFCRGYYIINFVNII